MLRIGSIVQAKIIEKRDFGVYLDVSGDRILLLAVNMIGSPAETAPYLSLLTLGQTLCVKITHHAENYHVYTSTMKGIGVDVAFNHETSPAVNR